LMDEPFGALDPNTRMHMQDLLVSLWREVEATVFFVTHSIEEAVYVSQSIALLLPRPSRVSEIIRPAIRRDISPDAIRRDPVYLAIVERIWQGLRTYVE
ncbi:MAG: ABC transporter ATP-binding protein, partial [Desulfofustis sp.]|nr:ABC transporter ATP-binding protein [Desulfofustis sp.]